ncbi:MAG: YtxH domain-containing protein [Gemmatimonadetes bacterium]|nr:YtxH domain-containing protein [Gemmatimonadota bacterium]
MADYDDLPTFVIETRGGGGGAGTFLLGALVGAAVALLLAPRSGSETQAEIAGAARRLRDGVEGRVTGVRDSVSDRVERTRDRVTGTFESVRGEVETRVGHARAALDAGVNAARDARGELQRRVDDAKRAYRTRRDGNGEDDGAEAASASADGDAPAALSAGDIVVTEVTTEEDQGDLA